MGYHIVTPDIVPLRTAIKTCQVTYQVTLEIHSKLTHLEYANSSISGYTTGAPGLLAINIIFRVTGYMSNSLVIFLLIVLERVFIWPFGLNTTNSKVNDLIQCDICKTKLTLH